RILGAQYCLQVRKAVARKGRLRLLAFGFGLLRRLPDLRPFLQIEILVPRAFLRRLTRRSLRQWLGRRYLGLLLASLHPEIPSLKAGRHRTIPPLLHAYIGSPES